MMPVPATMTTGSSPHARGTPEEHVRKQHAEGIIPACAGNTIHDHTPNASHWDHPRMRGEHSSCCSYSSRWCGSSPHARGTLCDRIRHEQDLGIIPACAGNTPGRWPFARTGWDHPRMRGEHRAFMRFCAVSLGSSPHARGTRWSDSDLSYARGIIPACAGNTAPTPGLTFGLWDHPRMRGEHLLLG